MQVLWTFYFYMEGPEIITQLWILMGTLYLFKHTRTERGLCSFPFIHQLLWVQKYQLWDAALHQQQCSVGKHWCSSFLVENISNWRAGISLTPPIMARVVMRLFHSKWQKLVRSLNMAPCPHLAISGGKEKVLSLCAGALGKQFTYFWGPISPFWHYPLRSDQ